MADATDAGDAADDGARDDESRDVDVWDAGMRGVGAAAVNAVNAGDVAGRGAHGDPETSGTGDRHPGPFLDAAPRTGPAPMTDPDRAAPHPEPNSAPHPTPHLAPYAQQDSRPVGPRPYVLAGGRTGGDGLPRMDALISVTPEGTLSVENPALSPEYRRICDMCREPMAVVEIAGRLRVPIGVAMVLIGDAIGWNLLREHTPAEVDGQPSIGVITRVHEGLLRLR
ncbi:DUF742 domain-containing protein [Streptosporangium sp. NPDC002721]|uniref:DUF742 domain-containing protein n=1 Tax=Streptosporangium sp. NPDC002721 TaxID=3366188 RepID=UPI0036A6FECC